MLENLKSIPALNKIGRNSDLICSIAYIAFFAIVLIGSGKWINSMTTSDNEIGPFAFPRAVCVISIILMAAVLFKQIVLAKKGLLYVPADGEKPTYSIMFMIIGLCIIYLYFLPIVGFIIMSLLFLPSLQFAVGNRSVKKIVLVTLGLFIVSFVFFIVLLKVQLPRGIGIFKQFSLLFY